MKILVISLAGIGDTLFATPLIHELRLNFPDAVVDALVLWRGSKDLLGNNPHLNAVYQRNLIVEPKIGSFGFLSTLRSVNYDVTINTFPQSRKHYRLVAKFIGMRTRASHEYENFGMFDRWLVNKVLPLDYYRHAVENNLALLSLVNAKLLLPSHRYEIFLADTDREWAENFLARQNLLGRPLLGIHIGSGGTKNLALRRWPLENFIELVRLLLKNQPELGVLFFGGPEEKSDHEKIRTTLGGKSLLFPKSENIRQAAALIGKCHFFLSVDTALMHVAAAMKVGKQVVIETPTWNKPIEPYSNPFTLVKNPAVADRNLELYRYDGAGIRGTREELLTCMKSVEVADVLAALKKLI